MKMKTVVTRHAALVEYLLVMGIITEGEYELFDHASPANVAGKDVIGVLPHALSSLTNSFTEVPMRIPADKRGIELTLEDMHLYAGDAVTYVVRAM